MEKEFRFYWEKPQKKKSKPAISLEVPGFRKSEIRVFLKENEITVTANRKKSRTEKGDNFIRQESYTSNFVANLPINDKINSNDYDIIISDGIVEIRKKRK